MPQYAGDMALIMQHANLTPQTPVVYAPALPVLVQQKELGTFEIQQEKFLNWIGKTKSAFVSNTGGGKASENYLIATDWHIPYHNEEKMAQMVEEFLAEFGSGNLVIGGDFLDGYSMNSYGQSKVAPFSEEIAAGRVVLEWLASKFDNIILIDDNHVDGRFRRILEKKIPADLHFLIQNPYDFLISGLPNVTHARKTYKNGIEIGWFVQIGDCIVAHAETHSAVPMKPVAALSDWIDNWNFELGLGQIRCVMEAHVHKLGMYYLPGRNRLIIETGSLVSPEGVGYSMGADLKYKPATNGCVWMVQENGVTNFNKTRVVSL